MLFRIAILFAAAAGAVLGSRVTGQEPPLFPARVELVRIDVVVLDRDGRPITGLTAADFEIREGGHPHEIASFEPIVVRPAATPASVEPPSPPRVSESIVPTPAESRYLLIFFDDVHVSAPAAARVRAQLAPFLERETQEGDWVTIVSPLAGLRWTARTAFERRQLPAVIGSLKGQLVRKLHPDDPSDFAAMRTEEFGSPTYQPPPGPNATFSPSPSLLAAEVYAVAKRRVRRSLSSLTEAIASLAGFRGRKSLMVYSEGFMKSPSMPDYDQAIETARRVGVSVRVMDPRGLGTGFPSPDGMDDGGPTLMSLDSEAGGSSYVAAQTGGRVSMSNDLTTPLREAAVEASAYYLLGFQPSAGPPGERKLKVRVLRAGLKVRAPDRYLAGDPASSAKAVPAPIRAMGRVSDVTDVPLRLGTLFLSAPTKGDLATTIVVELEPLAGEKEERRVDLLIEARALGRSEVVRDSVLLTLPPSDRPPVAARELHLAPGLWQARVVVYDARTERLGSVLHTFEVPPAAGLRLSSPVLSDALESSRIPRPRLRLDRRYRAGGVLYCQYQVCGAAPDPTTGTPQVSASYAIVRDGRALQEGAASGVEPTKDGQVLRLLAFGLSGLEPGDYTLVLRAADEVSGDRREIDEPFTIVPAEG